MATAYEIIAAYQDNNPNPQGSPSTVSYFGYRAVGLGNRTIRIDDPSPTEDKVHAAIAADVAFFHKFVGQKGTA